MSAALDAVGDAPLLLKLRSQLAPEEFAVVLGLTDRESRGAVVDQLRNAILRELVRQSPELRPTVAAMQTANDLSRYAATGWLRERHLPALPATCESRRVLMHLALRLNGGIPLGWRRLHDIAQAPP